MSVLSTQQLATLLDVKDTSVDAQVRRGRLRPALLLGRRAFDFATACQAARLFEVPRPTREQFDAVANTTLEGAPR